MYKSTLFFLLVLLASVHLAAQCNCSSTLPINSGLIACYPFNGNANDQTTNGNHGVTTNVTPVADRFGNPNSAYFFNGNNSIIKVPASTSLQPTRTMSISVWVRTEPKSLSPPTWSFILSYRNDNYSAPFNSYNLSTHPFSQYQHKWTFMLSSTSNTLDNELVGKYVKKDYVWEHIVATYDGSTMKLYTNGNLDTVRSINIPAIRYSGYGLNIGNHDAGPSTCIHGAMDDLRLYNRAITACEVKYLYNNCSGTPTGDLITEDTVVTCAGKGVQLEGSYNGMTYSWSPGAFLSDPTSKTPIATVSQSTYFFATATDGYCYYKDSVLVIVNQPTIQLNRSESICLGDSVMLQASGAQSYGWRYNTTLSDTSIANPFAKPLVTTKYYLKAIVNGCTVIDSVMVTLVNNLQVNAGSDTSLCKGSALQLNATGGSRFAWSPNIEINDTTINNPTITATQSRWYKVQSTSGTCEAKDSLFVTVNDNPTIHANDTVVCGLNNVFTPIINATAADNYLWQPSTYLSSANLKYPQISPKSSIAYIIKANNSTTRCSAIDTMFVLLGNPVADFTTPVPIVIIPETVSLTNSSNPNNLNYAWYLDETYFANTKHSQVNVYEEKSYHIKLVVTDSLGCMDSTTKLVEGKSNAKIFIPNVFTPNGDNANDVFSISFVPGLYLNFEGSIWNRWGQQITTFDALKGNWWDGTFEGKFCPDGVYFYIINTTNINNESKTYWGTLTLIR